MQLSISKKIALSIFGASAAAALVGLGGAFFGASKIVVDDLRAGMMKTAATEAHALEVYVESVRSDMSYLSAAKKYAQALTTLDAAFADVSQTELQNAYITDNPNPIGQKQLLDRAPGSAGYHDAHAAIHSDLRNFQESRGYYDIFLINASGDIVYSVFKELDYATNLVNGEYKDSGLGEAFRSAANLTQGEIAFADFSPYAPSQGAPAAFVAAPIFASGGAEAIGAVAVQIPSDRVAAAFKTLDGVVSYAAGLDGLLRTDLPSTDVNEILAISADGALVEAAVAAGMDQEAAVSTDGLLGVAAEAGVAKLDFLGATWVVIAEADRKKALAPVIDLELTLLAICAPILLIAAFGAHAMARIVAGSIERSSDVMRRLAAGDLEVEIPGKNRKDEIGAMAEAIEVFRTNAKRMKAMEEAREENEQVVAMEREEMMESLRVSFGQVVDAAVVGDFSNRVDANFSEPALNDLAAGVNRLMTAVGSCVEEVGGVMGRLAQGDLSGRVDGAFEGSLATLQRDINVSLTSLGDLVGSIGAEAASVEDVAGEITAGAQDLAGRAEQQASSLEETAATMEEMAATVKGSADNAAEAASRANRAAEQADGGGRIVSEAIQAMGQIEQSSEKISAIVSVIDGIAFQTNLLALNAAVEAARAGEAGKGFAVVASEVRTLAQRSSEASQDIRGLIETSSGHVANGVTLVRDAGASLEQIVASVRSVFEQLEEISSASNEQSTGVQEITSTVAHMDSMTQANAALADKSAANAKTLSERAGQLRELVGSFKTSEVNAGVASRPEPRNFNATRAERAPVAASVATAAAVSPDASAAQAAPAAFDDAALLAEDVVEADWVNF